MFCCCTGNRILRIQWKQSRNSLENVQRYSGDVRFPVTVFSKHESFQHNLARLAAGSVLQQHTESAVYRAT